MSNKLHTECFTCLEKVVIPDNAVLHHYLASGINELVFQCDGCGSRQANPIDDRDFDLFAASGLELKVWSTPDEGQLMPEADPITDLEIDSFVDRIFCNQGELVIGIATEIFRRELGDNDDTAGLEKLLSEILS